MEKRFGVLVRSYNKKGKSQEDIDKDITRAVVNARTLCELVMPDGTQALEVVMFVVPKDYDYGGTAERLRNEFEAAQLRALAIKVSGHHSCGALNQGLLRLRAYTHNYDPDVYEPQGPAYGIVISGKATAYMTPAIVQGIKEAFDAGARVVGVETDELAEIVAKGRVQNTFAAWDLDALFGLAPPAFDSEVGVEEYAPAARLVRQYGKCIAVLKPANMPPLNIRDNADGRARHEEVMQTKAARQQDEADRVGVQFDEVEAGILPGYPKTV